MRVPESLLPQGPGSDSCISHFSLSGFFLVHDSYSYLVITVPSCPETVYPQCNRHRVRCPTEHSRVSAMLRTAHRHRHIQLMDQSQVAGTDPQKHQISKPLVSKRNDERSEGGIVLINLYALKRLRNTT